MKKSIVEETFIPISAVDQQKILNYSGIKLVNVRTGNRFHSTRNIKVFDPFKNKRNWDVAMYAYNKVTDPRYFNGRKLETSEIFLNPKYIFLLDLCRDLIEVTYQEYTDFIKNMKGLIPVTGFCNRTCNQDPSVVSEYIVDIFEMRRIVNKYNLPIVARKIFDAATEDYKYYLSANFRTYLEEGYFNG